MRPNPFRSIPARIVFLAFIGLSALIQTARAEKLQVVVDYVTPLKDTDVSSGRYQLLGDRGDVYLHLEVTPQNGNTRILETDVVDNALIGTRLFEGHTFDTLSVPPRPVTVNWEVRDRDGESAYHVMASGSTTIANDGETHTWQQLAYGAEAYLGLTVRWLPDWDRLFGIVCNPEDGCLNLAKFAKGIEDRFGPAATKYGYRVQVGFAVHEKAVGVGRSSADSPADPSFSLDDRFNPASMTKTVTAVALLRAMEKKGISIDASIADYLPSYWDIPQSIEILTFRELLSHHSGLQGAAATLPQLRNTVEGGANLLVKLFSYANGGFDYENVNYALCRVLLVYVLGFDDTWYASNPTWWEPLHAAQISFIYQDYLRNEIFEPIGIHDVTFTPVPNSTLFYPNPATGNGTNFDDWSGREGYAGVQLSLREYARFQRQLWNSETYVSKFMREAMKTARLGMFEYMGVNDGLAYGHNGWFPAGSWNSAGVMAEVQTCHLRFANGVQVVWMINGNASMPWAVNSVIDAYNEAWYDPAISASSAFDSAVLQEIAGYAAAKFTESDLSRAMSAFSTDSTKARQFELVSESLRRSSGQFAITDISLDPRTRECRLGWPSKEGCMYQLLSSSDTRRWFPVGSEMPAEPSGYNTARVAVAGNTGFFKIARRIPVELQVVEAGDLLRQLEAPRISRVALLR